MAPGSGRNDGAVGTATPDRRATARPSARRRRLRLYAAAKADPRSRRATDVIRLVAAASGLALLSLIAIPPAGFERALITFISAGPGSLANLWQFLVDLLALLAVVLLVAAVVRRRLLLARDLMAAAAVALGASLAIARLVQGSWPPIWDALSSAEPPPFFPFLRLALPCAVVMTASPHLSLSARRVGRLLIPVAAGAAAVLGATTPSGALAGVLIGAMTAATVHLIFGSSSGRPSVDAVAAALDALRIGATSLGAPDRQPAGFFLVHAEDEHGDPLVVKVYGRDAHDTQLLTTLWRTVWYRAPGSPIVPGRRQQVEHEAFLTLLAGQAGVITQKVVTAGATAADDVLLVLRPVGEELADVPARWSPDVVKGVWSVLQLLHRTGIAHGQVDDHHLVILGDDVGLIDFRGGVVAPSEERLRTDEAQALVATVLAVGREPGLEAAARALGPDGLAAALPFVQVTALTGAQRADVRRADLDLDDLRDGAAVLTGVEPPKLVRLRRVTWGSVLQVALLVFAFFAMASTVGGLDLDNLRQQLRDATWWFVVVGVLLAQLPRLSQAVSTLGASPIPLPLGPVYALQLAVSYINLALPSTAARIAVNIRFLQRHGLPPGSALAVGAIDGFSGFVVQMGLLLGILLFTPASLELDLGGQAPSGIVRLLVVVVLVAVGAVATVVIVPRWRRAVLARLRVLLGEALGAVRGLRSPRRITMLLVGAITTEVLFAAALGATARAFGYPIGLSELLLINMSVALLAGVLPIPGGIGVVEGGLTFGLVRAGMPEEAAFAAVLLYRLATFYLPPIWGFFAFRWLQRNKHL